MAAGAPAKDLPPVRGLLPGREPAGCARAGIPSPKDSGGAPPGNGTAAGRPP